MRNGIVGASQRNGIECPRQVIKYFSFMARFSSYKTEFNEKISNNFYIAVFMRWDLPRALGHLGQKK